jgi:hypothetical protein
VLPGRHWIHAVRRDTVAARWRVDVEPGANEVLHWPETDAAWNALAAGLGTSTSTPPGLGDALESRGGEVWVARAQPKSLEVWRVNETRIEPVVLQRDSKSAVTAPNDVLTMSAGGGWFSHPTSTSEIRSKPERTVATVNAAPSASALWRHARCCRIGAGADLLATLGDVHVAHYGGEQTASLAASVRARRVQGARLTGGFLFPHHVAVGARCLALLGSGR